MAYSLCVCFSRTRYTLPTSPLPSRRTLWKLDGPTSRLRTRIDELEYVRRKAARGEPASPPSLREREAPPAGDGGARRAEDERSGERPFGADEDAICGVERERVGESCCDA